MGPRNAQDPPPTATAWSNYVLDKLKVLSSRLYQALNEKFKDAEAEEDKVLEDLKTLPQMTMSKILEQRKSVRAVRDAKRNAFMIRVLPKLAYLLLESLRKPTFTWSS